MRIVDYAKPEEVSGSTVNNVTANWSCAVTAGVTPPSYIIDSSRTTQIACQTTDTGNLAAGANRVLTFTTTLAAVAAPVSLVNRACTGGRALEALGLVASDGPQPADSSNANDCATVSTTLVVTPVVSGEAQASVIKESSINGSAYFDPVGAAPTLAGDNNRYFWRMVVTTPAILTNLNQKTIPTLRLNDTIPGRLNAPSGAPVLGYRTPATTVTTTPNTYGSCPNLAAGTAGNSLACNFTNVPPGTTITIDLAVDRPVLSGTWTNTASLTSPNAVLTAVSPGQLSDDARIIVTPRVDMAVTTKSVQPAVPRVGEQVQFTITAQNLGRDDVGTGQFTVTDFFDMDPDDGSVGYEVVSASGANMNCSASNLGTGAISCTNTNLLASYAVRTISITARIKKPLSLPSSGAVYTNQTNTANLTLSGLCEYRTETVTIPGGVSSVCNDTNSVSNNARTATFNVLVPAIDMQQRKERVLPAGQNSFGIGDQLRYRFRVQANGPSRAEHVTMTDTLSVPTGFALTLAGGAMNINGTAADVPFSLDLTKSGSVTCSQAGVNGIVTCLMSAVPANNFMDTGREVNFELAFNMTPDVAAAAVQFSNAALVCADETQVYESSGACNPDPDVAGNNIASTNDIVFPKTDLELVTKTTETPSPASINQPVQYNLVLRNNGTSTAFKMRLQDTLPTGIEWIGLNAPLVTVDGGSAATLTAVNGFLTVSDVVPANGTENVCYVSNGVTSVNNLINRQQITCDISGEFPPGPGNTVTLRLFARAKEGVYDGSANAPYLSNRINDATVMPGKDLNGNDVSIDIVPGNNAKASSVQIQNAQLSGRTYLDLNGNNVQNGTASGEDYGFGNVVFNLRGTDLYGNLVSRSVISNDTITPVRGDYLFANLPPSDSNGYTITQTQPAADNRLPLPGTGTTSPGIPNNDVAVSSTVPVGAPNSVISGIVLAAAQTGVNFDFPEALTGILATISGVVFNDSNGNGIKDTGESGISGVLITLSNGATATTSADGSYTFSNLQPGDYSVTETDPSGYSSTTANTVSVTVPPGGSAVANFGDRLPLGSISGVVFNDSNGNGIKDTGESGISGVLITLSNGATATTSADGSYTFSNLQPGDYSVTETDPSGYSSTTANTVSVTVPPGGSAVANFGDRLPLGSISGVVFNDSNGNGIKDTGESGISGVLITLSNGATATTSADGSYTFSNLQPGDYSVTETDPSGYSSTTANTVSVTVPPGGSAVANFGDRLPLGSISGVVFNDSNGNGIKDTGESGISGVLITLSNGATATTSADGSYTFSNLQPGNYTVVETDPSGYISTSKNTVAVTVIPGGTATANFGDQSSMIVPYSIPTMSEWGMILLFAALALLSALRMRKA